MEKALEKESEQGLQVEQAVDEGQQEEVDQGNAATAELIPAGDEASATPTLDAFAESQGVEEAPAPEVEGGFSAGGQDSSAPSGGGGGGPASIGGGGGGESGAPQPPTITAADASGEGTDSFDAFSDSTASQQAAWWSDLDSDLGESMAEEESAFQEGLPVFSAVMSGEDPSGAKATPLPTVAANLSGMDQGGGAVPDAAIAETQNLGSSDIEAGSLSGFSAEGGDNAAAIGAAMSAIPTTDGSVQTSPGPAPNVPLAGDADPARVGAQMSEGLTQAAAAQQEAMAAVAASPGPELVQPLAMNEEMSLSGITPATTMPDEGEVGGMLDFQELGLSSDVVGAFDELNSSEMQGHMDTAASEMDAASVQRDADRTTALGQADADAQSMVTDAHDQQTAMVADQRSAIDAKRQETVQAQAAAVAGVQTEASSRHASVTGDIESRVAADQARVASEFESADSKASSEVAKGEAKAEAEKKKAEKEAEEDGGGWFSAALDFVASAIDAVASAIGSIFDAVRSAVTAILDGVKALANSIIDAAVSFVTAAISAYGDFLKGVIQGLLGDVFPGLADALCSAVDAVVDYAMEKVTALGESLKEGFAALCDGLAAGINAVLDVYEAAIQVALSVAKAIATGDWKEALMMALQAALKLAGINEEEFFAMVGKGEDAIMSIIDDPGGFLSNCIDAVALGFGNFADNFLDHLQTGFIDWLTGSVGEAGIVMPPELNMAGILDITMQVLGLSYDMLREKAVEHLGEDNVALMEEVWGFIEAAISGGLSGLWEHVQGYLDGLWDAVIGGIQEFLMEKIIVAAVTKLASMFNPVAAIVQALMTAWDLYCWARDQMQRIYGVVTAFIDSMSDMATGNIDPAANKIEDSLAGLVPVAIDLLASILGLGGISDKVKGVIESVQQMVSDAIDSMIENVKGMFPGGGDQDEAETEGGAEEGEEAPDEERSKYGGADAPESALANVVNSMPVPEIMGDDKGHMAHLTASGQVILTSTPTVAKPEHEGALRAQLEGDATGEVYIDPRSTLDEAGEYGKFKADFQRIAEEVGLSAADSEAERIWMLAVELCQSVNAAAAGAPSYADREGVEIPAGQEEESKKRKDLQSATFKKIIQEFQPLINGFSEYMEAWDAMCQNTQWAFWSGQPGMAMATKHMGGRALEASPIGQAFNRCRIPGHDNFQLWPALSTAYAKFAGENMAEREYHGFLGRGSGVEASVWNMVEQPVLIEMAGEARQEVPQVRWHACKGMANAPSTIDESVSGGDNGWVGTIESSDDRAAMVALADQEMGDMKKRVVPLLADKVESAVDWKADVVTRHWMNTEILKAHYKKNDANDDEGIRFGEEVVAGSRQAGKDKLNASTDLIFKEYWEVDVTRDESAVDTNAFRDWLVTTKASKARTLFLEAMGESAEIEMKRIGRAYVANEPVMLMNEIEAISYNINDGNYGKFGVAPPRESDHKGYKPVGLTWDADKQNFEYGYEGQGASFKGSLGKDGIIQDLSGEGLHLKKDAGIFGRGATGDAGRSTANSNQNASHLIADQFMGSGYKAAENLITTSDRYNQTVMSGVEGQIKEKVMAFIERAAEANFDRVDVTFGLKVELEWFSVVGTDAIQSMLADPAFCEELLHAYEGWEQSTLVEKIKETLVTWMNGQSANLMRVKECTYTLTLPEMGEIGSETHLLSAGPDLYMGLLSMGQ